MEQTKAKARRPGPTPTGWTASLWGHGRLCAVGPGGPGGVPGHPRGGAGGGRGGGQAGAPERRGDGTVPGQRGPGESGAIFENRAHRTGTAGHPELFGLLPGLPAHLRTGGGGDRAQSGRRRHRRPAVRRRRAAGDPRGGQPVGRHPLRPGQGRHHPDPAPAGAAAVHHLSAGGGTPLWGVPAAVHALSDRRCC